MTISSKSLERLRGLLLWFDKFICGRQANFLVARLGKVMSGDKGSRPLDGEVRVTLTKLLERILAGRPANHQAGPCNLDLLH